MPNLPVFLAVCARGAAARRKERDGPVPRGPALATFLLRIKRSIMPERSIDRFSAEGLAVDQIMALKKLEQRNRDLGAQSYLQVLQDERGIFNLHAEAHALMHHISPRRNETVLDAGAGVGRLALLVAPKVARLVCVDLSAAALGVLQSRASEKGTRNIETLATDLSSLPDSLGPFDRAYSVEVFSQIPSRRERREALGKIYGSLRPGGRCVVSVFCWNWRNRRVDPEKEGFWGTGERRLYGYLFTPLELGALLEEAGFRDIRLRGLMLLPGRITRHLPLRLAPLETWCSRVPGLSGMGRYVLASGRR